MDILTHHECEFCTGLLWFSLQVNKFKVKPSNHNGEHSEA